VTAAALAAALLLTAVPGSGPGTGPQPSDGPTLEEVAAARAGPLAVAPWSLSLGAGHHSAYGLGGWVLAVRGGAHLRPGGLLSIGPLAPEVSLQVTYARTAERVGLGRFRAGLTWWRELGRLHLGAGASAGWLWVDGPGRVDPGLIALAEVAAGVELVRLRGVRASFDLRGGFDPWHPGEPEGLALLTFRY